MNLESSYEIFDSAIRQALKNYWGMECYEDLYQECYMKILDVLKNNTYEPVLNLYGYAYKIARNAISTYMYHENKLTTLASEDFPDIPVREDFDSSLIMDEIITQALNKYRNSLPTGFTKQDAMDLLLSDNPKTLSLTVLKGEILWNLEFYHRDKK